MGLLVLFWPQQPAAPQLGFVNLSLAEQDMWPALNATSAADAVFWADPEIFDYFDECAKKLARGTPLFVTYDSTLSSISNQGNYALPIYHVNSIQVDLAGAVLYPRTVKELEALDAGWQGTTGTPTSFLEDVGGLVYITLYPAPSTGGAAINIVMQRLPNDVSVGSAIIFAPQVLREYFTFYAIAEARAKESPSQMPEISQWLKGVLGMMDQAIGGLWKP